MQASQAAPADAILSFEDVYARYASKIHAFCVVQLRDMSAAEDVCSDVFLAAFKAYDRVQPNPDGVYYWLMRIAKNVVIDHQRRKQRFGYLITSLTRERRSHTADVEALAGLNEEMRGLVSAMRSLKSREQLLISLRYAADLPFKEIGELVGESTETAARATHRAAEKLRKAWVSGNE